MTVEAWHEAIDREPTLQGERPGVGVLISELFGVDDSDEVARQIEDGPHVEEK